jgi:hypothetical protein
MAIIPARNLRPRMNNYRRARGAWPGMGGCNPGETKDLPGGGQQMCNDDGLTWSSYTAPAAAAALPPVVYNAPSVPTYANCDPTDVACVQRNQAAGTGYSQAVGVQQADADFEQCMLNGNGNAVCRARWPVGYSGDVPFNNLSPAQQVGTMATPAAVQTAALAQQVSAAATEQAALIKAQAVANAAGPQPQITAGAPSGASLPFVTPGLVQSANSGTASTGLSLSSVPSWLWWAGAVAAGLYAMR